VRVRRWVCGGLVLGTVAGFVAALVRSHAPDDARPAPAEARPATADASVRRRRLPAGQR
jgi:hypothetical protein